MDGDIHWHLAAGREITAHGAVPASDPWTYTAQQTWYNLSWLFDVAVSEVSLIIGEKEGLYIFALALGALLSAEIFRLLPAWGVGGAVGRAICAMVCGVGLIGFSSLRPQMIACFLALYLLWILREASCGRHKLLLFLPFLAILWVNIHSSFLVLFAFCGASAIGSILSKNRRYFLWLSAATLFAAAATFINPLGASVYAGVMRSVDSAMVAYIHEWRGWTPGVEDWREVRILFYMIVLLFCSVILRAKTLGLTERILVFGFVVLTFSSEVNFPFLVIVGAPFVYNALQPAFCASTDKLSSRAVSVVVANWLYVLFVLTLFSWASITQKFADNSKVYRLDEEPVIAIAANFPEARVINDYNLGGAVANLSDRSVSYYIDGRGGAAFDEGSLGEYLQSFIIGNVPIGEVLKKWNPAVAFFQKGSRDGEVVIPQLEAAAWHKFYENPKNVIYISPSEADRLYREKTNRSKQMIKNGQTENLP